MISCLKDLERIVEVIMSIHDIDGFLGDSEAMALYHMARYGPGDGEIVEIGSFKGRSTTCLAMGSMDSEREKITSIDPHHGARNIMHKVPEGGTEKVFKENLQKFGVAEHVDPYTATSAKMAETWDKEIRLLFIDGDHDYEVARLDYELWEPHLIKGGLIAIHDTSGGYPGPMAVVNQFIQNSKKFKDVVRFNSLTIAAKVM